MEFRSFVPPQRTLMGPGPSDVPPSVLAALSLPTLGHLDPAFIGIMEEVRGMLQQVFGTANPMTIPVSATGSAGMEAAIHNLLQPGDRALIGVNGVFGERMCAVAARAGAEVVRVEAPWGRALDPDDLRRAAASGPFTAMALVHAETSTGVLQDLSPMRQIADSCGARLLVDTVTSLGGTPVELDKHGVDAAYSGTRKCISCPPGLAPVSFSNRVIDAIPQRREPPRSWYLDLDLLSRYWVGSGTGRARAYHHTAPVHMIYALHEALRLILEEGLEARYERHRSHSRALRAGLTALGLELPVPHAEHLPQLTLVSVPEGVDEAAVRKQLLARYNLEIGGGLGAFAGKAWRIGLMGASCTGAHVRTCLAALADALAGPGRPTAAEALVAAEAEMA